MDLLGAAYGSSDEEEEESAGAKEAIVAETKAVERKPKVVKFQVPALELKEEDEYKPKRRKTGETASASLLDSLPAPQAELYEFKPKGGGARSEGSSREAGRGGGGESASAPVSAPVSIEAAPETPSNPNDMYRVGAGGQYAFDYSAYGVGFGGQQSAPPRPSPGPSGAEAVLELALEEERKRKHKRGYRGADVMIDTVNAADLRGDGASVAMESNHIRDALGEGYEEKLRRQATSHQPSQMARRKHQIGSLLHQSKVGDLVALFLFSPFNGAMAATKPLLPWSLYQLLSHHSDIHLLTHSLSLSVCFLQVHELDMLTNRTKSMKTKRETQAKYGW